MRILDRLEELIITFLIGAATVIIFVAVIHRYAAGLPIPGLQEWLLTVNMSWAQELCIYMFVWMAKFGAAYGVRTGIHVGVDVLINRLPAKWRKTSVLLGLTSGVLFTGIIGTLGARFVWETGCTMRYTRSSEWTSLNSLKAQSPPILSGRPGLSIWQYHLDLI